MIFGVGTYRCSRKTLEEQARKKVIEETGNPNPTINFGVGTYRRSKATLEQQVRNMIEQNKQGG